jgi:hypothetical protein
LPARGRLSSVSRLDGERDKRHAVSGLLPRAARAGDRGCGQGVRGARVRATSTASIVNRVGISQPYIYALFPNKHELFLAAHEHVVQHIRRVFADAARGHATAEDRLLAMGDAYLELLGNRDEILFQMQATPPPAIPRFASRCARSSCGWWRMSGA